MPRPPVAPMRLLTIPAVLLAALACASSAPAQDDAQFDMPGRILAKTYFFKEAGVDVPYDLYISRRYQKDTPAPLLVALHGGGSPPRSIMQYQGLIELAEQRGYIVVAPMGFSLRGGFGNPRSGQRAAGEPENISQLSQQDVMNVVAEVRGHFSIDPKRIYLMGHSMGGGGTWYLGIQHPDIWAAIAPVSPSISTSPDALNAITKIPVIVIQGDADQSVSVDVTRKWVAKMKELSMKYEYIEVPGGDHFGVIMGSPQNMRRIFDFFAKSSK